MVIDYPQPLGAAPLRLVTKIHAFNMVVALVEGSKRLKIHGFSGIPKMETALTSPPKISTDSHVRRVKSDGGVV